MTVTVTAEKLADEAFGNQPRNAPDDAELARATRVLPVAVQAVTDYAPDALADEAVIRFGAYLLQARAELVLPGRPVRAVREHHAVRAERRRRKATPTRTTATRSGRSAPPFAAAKGGTVLTDGRGRLGRGTRARATTRLRSARIIAGAPP